MPRKAQPKPAPRAARRLPPPPLVIEPDEPEIIDHREQLDSADDDAAQFLAAIGHAGEEGQVTAYRIVGGIKRYLPERFDAAGFDLSKIHTVYGGGDFLLEFRIGGQIRKKARVNIEGAPKTPPSQDAAALATIPAADPFAARIERLEMMLTQRLAAPAAPAADPIDQMQKFAALSQAMTAPLLAMMQSQQRTATPASELAGIMNIARDLANGQQPREQAEPDQLAGLAQLASAAGEFVAAFKKTPGPAAPQPQQPPAPRPADIIDTTARQTPEPAAPADDEPTHPIYDALSAQQQEAVDLAIGAIGQAAHRKTPAKDAAGIVRHLIGRPDIDNLATLGAEQVAGFVLALAPELTPHAVYVRAVADALATQQEDKK